MDKEINDFKEMRNDFENAQQVLQDLNDDKRAMELAQDGVKKALEKIDAVEKKRREDSHKWNSLSDDMKIVKQVMGDFMLKIYGFSRSSFPSSPSRSGFQSRPWRSQEDSSSSIRFSNSSGIQGEVSSI